MRSEYGQLSSTIQTSLQTSSWVHLLLCSTSLHRWRRPHAARRASEPGIDLCGFGAAQKLGLPAVSKSCRVVYWRIGVTKHHPFVTPGMPRTSSYIKLFQEPTLEDITWESTRHSRRQVHVKKYLGMLSLEARIHTM